VGLTTWSEVIRAPLPHGFDAPEAAAREVGSVQIQNRGTIAGNLCNASPAADGVPPCLRWMRMWNWFRRREGGACRFAQFLAGNRKTVAACG